MEPASAAGVAGLLKKHRAGEAPKGKTIVITVTGHGLKDPQWALEAVNGVKVEPTKAPSTWWLWQVFSICTSLFILRCALRPGFRGGVHLHDGGSPCPVTTYLLRRMCGFSASCSFTPSPIARYLFTCLP